MTRTGYYLLVVVVGVMFLSFVYTFIGSEEGVKPAEALEAKGSFTVIDTYRGCDVVQWHYGMLADYKYFLDCTDSMRNK